MYYTFAEHGQLSLCEILQQVAYPFYASKPVPLRPVLDPVSGSPRASPQPRHFLSSPSPLADALFFLRSFGAPEQVLILVLREDGGDSHSADRINLIRINAFSACFISSLSPSAIVSPAWLGRSGSATESANWDIEEKESWREVTIDMSWGVRVLRICTVHQPSVHRVCMVILTSS
jgi:hypothetical protein